MALYSYIKVKPRPQRKFVATLSYGSMVLGSIFLFWSFYPIVSFEIYSKLFIKNRLTSPLPYSNIASALEKANSVLGTYSALSTNLADYTKAGIWFPSRSQGDVVKDVENIAVKEYSLSIPKLNIEDAKVVVGGEDLKKSLIHYLPTTLPGEKGNVAIFGHSTLPQLYNAKDYKTIFTYLPQLERGDAIYIKLKDFEYEYKVFDMLVVSPDQVNILDQRQDDSFLTLVTCVPPGTYWKRLVVKARLSKL